ncbi:hypothetical protein TBLA_0C05490 [Henningerozyma blattae CBS 6284]|uniref:DNA mismatch repair proteins mutS family domain-containing protein n=1 Tax=Henningerozyma blattae (strain ATCC 34711 / CBS 6284 / DSM 70876 / NBRC 10599 / NRRL Y-10934 / UCD 77-7) TaxID=1071380 RepID=I2H1U5_HENB6|nr:hypothetical protein TBLA_0C05490 [Tetrapisispora blattae CBS 6284]CCH60347.1 hypothetical protein TBLA_0C05490 [Tetrapisispora blattae CBS 6284]
MLLLRKPVKLCPGLFIRYNHTTYKPIGKVTVTNLLITVDKPGKKTDVTLFDKKEKTIILDPIVPTNGNIKLIRNELQYQNDTVAPVRLPESLQYVRTLMDHYKDHVVLTQVGSFYELYFEHATKYAPDLNITLTSKQYKFGRIAFAGFPVNQLGRYLKILVNQHGYSVTIAEQYKDEGISDNETNKIRRKVARIVTPGTFIDEAFEHFNENTYLLNIELPENCTTKLSDPNMKVGLCWCDITTGELYTQEVILEELTTVISRIKPKEILLDDSFEVASLESGKWFSPLVELKKYFLKYQKTPSQHFKISDFYKLFTDKKNEKQLDIYFETFSQKEIASLKNILIYVQEHLPDISINFQLPEKQLLNSMMQIDSRTMNSLEVHSTMRTNSRKGSLLSTVKRVVTPAGSRLLTMWLSGPSLDLKEIKKRQKIVTYFLGNNHIQNMIISQLKDIQDLFRIIQKFSFGQGGAEELIQVAQSLKSSNQIAMLLKDCDCNQMTRKLLDEIIENLIFDNLLIEEILKGILPTVDIPTFVDENINTASENTDNNNKINYNKSNFLLDPNYSPILEKLYKEYEILQKGKDNLLSKYEDILLKEYNAKSVELKQKQTNEYALYVRCSPTNSKRINEFIKSDQGIIDGEPFKILQNLSQNKWLSHKSWTDLALKIELSAWKIRNEENAIIDRYKKQFVSMSKTIRQIAYNLSYLDVLVSFSVLAKEKGLVKPKLDKSNKLEIIGGRHLMVEDGLSSKTLTNFVSNDCNLEKQNLWVITGPNMGGKSTFLRQNAIIVILAQIGCFVPCTSAHIGITDKIFSRVGTADDLYNEMSTFMVEMIETSFILKGATPNSLAILDEIGRGTSGKEGVSIAYATIKYLITHNKCRTLFATHFGEELKELLTKETSKDVKDNVKFFKSSILENKNGTFVYNHRLKEGICKSSDALKVAQAAGFPEQAIQEAKELLQQT